MLGAPAKLAKDGMPLSELFDQQYLRRWNNFLKDFEHAFDREFQGLV